MNIVGIPFSPNADKTTPLAIDDVPAFLASKYVRGCVFGQDLLIQDGVFKYLGWIYDFKPYLKKYLVQDKHYPRTWLSYYAPNKTMLREVLQTKEKIIEVKE